MRIEDHPADDAGHRAISAEDRSGVLHPDNVRRFDARWVPPSTTAADVVDHYWWVRWSVPPGEVVEQRVIEFPGVTLSIEQGDVPAPLVVTGVSTRAWGRAITGTGSAFGIRLRPAGLSTLGSVTAGRVADATVALTPELDPRLHAFLRQVAASTTPERRARAADDAVAAAVSAHPPTASALLANRAVDALRATVRSRTGTSLADQLGVSERAVQRALQGTLGRGPKWVSRRVRLQEVARQLADPSDVDLADLAATLGYSDQAHLTNDFRTVAGTTPGEYRRALQQRGR